jgi:hypothetical protein
MRSFEFGSLVFGLFVAIAAGARAQTQPAPQPLPYYVQQPGAQQPAAYQQPVQPGYQQPVQPGYQQPVQPGYQQPVQPGYQQPVQPGYQTGYQQPYQTTTSSRRTRDPEEMGALYVTSAAYGMGLGIWASTEMGLKDPGIFLIAPIALGVAAPIGAFALDSPKMKRGQPMAITAGLLLGAGEGLGIWGIQRVTANSSSAWGFRGLARSAALGSTIGGVAGYFAGEFLEPPPTTSTLAVSGAMWGTAIGSMFGYGASNGAWGQANDRTAIGGLVGYNVGMLAAGGLGSVLVPSANQVAWMWGGAGIGAAVSLPVFLLYAGEGGPPARRGFIFMGTATTLGLIAGGVFSSGKVSAVGQRESEPTVARRGIGRFGTVHALIPMIAPEQVGLSVFGSLE